MVNANVSCNWHSIILKGSSIGYFETSSKNCSKCHETCL